MNVHIYKGDVGKSTIMSQMMNFMGVIGIILYSEDRPYPNINGTFMVSREYVTPEDLATEFLPMLLREESNCSQTVIIYTNYTEKENAKYIEAIKEVSKLGTVIVMCKEN